MKKRASPNVQEVDKKKLCRAYACMTRVLFLSVWARQAASWLVCYFRLLLCTYPVILSLYMYVFIFSFPVAIFRTGLSLVEYCSGSFRPFLQSDY